MARHHQANYRQRAITRSNHRLPRQQSPQPQQGRTEHGRYSDHNSAERGSPVLGGASTGATTASSTAAGSNSRPVARSTGRAPGSGTANPVTGSIMNPGSLRTTMPSTSDPTGTWTVAPPGPLWINPARPPYSVGPLSSTGPSLANSIGPATTLTSSHLTTTRYASLPAQTQHQSRFSRAHIRARTSRQRPHARTTRPREPHIEQHHPHSTTGNP